MSELQFVEGVVAFSNLTQHDVYQGKDTGNYTLTITLDPQAAQALENQGVKLKDYNGTPQRKFKSQYKVGLIDAEDNKLELQEIPFGSTVRVLFKAGNSHPEHGTPVYMNKIRVLEMAEPEAPDEF